MTANATRETLLIAIVDDDESHGALLEHSVRDAEDELGCPIETACFTDPADAIATLAGEPNCLVICDYNLGGGSTAIDWIQDFSRASHGPVLVATSHGSEQIATKAFRGGAADYLNKANAISDSGYLAHSIKESLRRYRLSQTVKELSGELRRANRELAYKNKQLEATTQAAHAFVDDVAHDFRTPIAVIKEFASIISDGLAGPVTDEQTEHLAYVDRATDDLAAMIDDFLDSTRLRAGLLRLDRHPIEIRRLHDHIAPMIESRAASKNITIEADLPPSVPRVFVDLFKASRILTNIAVNAIKFSPAGSTVRITAEEAGPCWVRYSVHDSGPGIAHDDLQVIFERFGQVNQNEYGRIKGFGLGLSIATQLAAMNFGRLEVASEPGDGSVFSVIFPQSDPQRLLRAYIHHAAEREIKDPLAVIRCRPDAQTSTEELAAYLSATCWTDDLIVDLADHGVLLAGAASEPERWLSRLMAVSEKTTSAPDGLKLSFTAELEGAWRSPNADDVIRACFTPTEGARRVAA